MILFQKKSIYAPSVGEKIKAKMEQKAEKRQAEKAQYKEHYATYYKKYKGQQLKEQARRRAKYAAKPLSEKVAPFVKHIVEVQKPKRRKGFKRKRGRKKYSSKLRRRDFDLLEPIL